MGKEINYVVPGFNLRKDEYRLHLKIKKNKRFSTRQIYLIGLKRVARIRF